MKIYLQQKSIDLMAFKNLLTTVDGQEEGSVDAVVDEWGLAVQHGGGVHSPVDGVNVQPACWILVDRIPAKVPNSPGLHSR